jgi:hypothetical protein
MSMKQLASLESLGDLNNDVIFGNCEESNFSLNVDFGHPKMYETNRALRVSLRPPNCTKTVDCRGFAPDPTGEHAPQIPFAF